MRRKLFLVPTVSIVSIFLVLELILQKYDIDQIRGIIRNNLGENLSECVIGDKTLDHKLLPNCEGKIKTKDFESIFRTNSLGFVDGEIPDKGSLKRVLIIGDSFAEGWGVSPDKRFDNIESDSFEIINLATRSYSPVLQKRLLELHIEKIKPDLVITFLDMSDLHDDYYYSNKLGITPNVEYGIFRYSKLLSTIKRQVVISQSQRNKNINPTNLTYDFSLFGKAQEWDNYDESWDYTRQIISDTKTFLNNKGIDHKLVVVPRGIHIGPKEWDQGRELVGFEKNKLYKLPSIFEASDIDITTALIEAEANNEGSLYYSFDGHWNEKGHEVVKTVLSNYLDNLYQNTLPKTKMQ